MNDILKTILERQSARMDFEANRPIPDSDLRQILEAARWAPTPHNMQNFQIIVVDDPKLLEKISHIPSPVSRTFLRENYEQLSFSEQELQRKKVGVLAAMFPPSWIKPPGESASGEGKEQSFLRVQLQHCSALLVVIFDPRKRAPASEGDFLGIMGLGCMMENMWLMAQSLGIGFHVLSAFGSGRAEPEAKKLLGIPSEYRIAFAARLGYSTRGAASLRVRRDVQEFAHHNGFGAHFEI